MIFVELEMIVCSSIFGTHELHDCQKYFTLWFKNLVSKFYHFYWIESQSSFTYDGVSLATSTLECVWIFTQTNKLQLSNFKYYVLWEIDFLPMFHQCPNSNNHGD